jgi:Spy/CpxP family protein refolding chaperone
MKRSVLRYAGLVLAAGGLIFAQEAVQPGGGSQPGMHRSHRANRGAGLNLTDDQKAQAKQIFTSTREQSQALRQQLRDARKALNDAAKAGKPDAEIDQLANAVAPLEAQMAAIHAKAFGKFYAMLTPDQKAQVDQRGGMMSMHGRAR